MGFELPEYDFLGDAVTSKVDELVNKFKEWAGLTDDIDTWAEFLHRHRDEILKKQREYNEAHKEQRREYHKKYYQAHRNELLENGKEYYNTFIKKK